MKKIFTPILSSIFVLTMLASCGNVDGVSKNGLSSKDISMKNASFNKSGSWGKKEGFANKFGMQKSPITLTADQQTQLKALQDEEKKHFDIQKDNMTKIKDLFKTAFTSDSINKDDLKAKVSALKPNQEDELTFRANSMLKHFQILTAEQRKTLEAGRADMEKKIADMQAKMKANTKFNPADMQTKMLDGLAKKLTLTDDQKNRLKDVFTANKPADPATMMTKMQESQKAIQTELNSGKATVDSLKTILKANMPEDRLDKHLDVLVKVHDILTADQRKLAGSFPMFDGGFGKKGGKGFGFGFGKGHKGGHGPEMMGGFGAFGGKGGFTPPSFF